MTGLPVEGDEYFSFEDVNMEFLDESPTYTVCSWQEEPSYDAALWTKGGMQMRPGTTRIRPRRRAGICRQGPILAGVQVTPSDARAGEWGRVLQVPPSNRLSSSAPGRPRSHVSGS
jgi:hypothetical protein